jgi:hypothetical protein
MLTGKSVVVALSDLNSELKDAFPPDFKEHLWRLDKASNKTSYLRQVLNRALIAS